MSYLVLGLGLIVTPCYGLDMSDKENKEKCFTQSGLTVQKLTELTNISSDKSKTILVTSSHNPNAHTNKVSIISAFQWLLCWVAYNICFIVLIFRKQNVHNYLYVITA